MQKDYKFRRLRHPARGDSLKDYPAPAYNKVGQHWCRLSIHDPCTCCELVKILVQCEKKRFGLIFLLRDRVAGNFICLDVL